MFFFSAIRNMFIKNKKKLKINHFFSFPFGMVEFLLDSTYNLMSVIKFLVFLAFILLVLWVSFNQFSESEDKEIIDYFYRFTIFWTVLMFFFFSFDFQSFVFFFWFFLLMITLMQALFILGLSRKFSYWVLYFFIIIFFNFVALALKLDSIGGLLFDVLYGILDFETFFWIFVNILAFYPDFFVLTMSIFFSLLSRGFSLWFKNY